MLARVLLAAAFAAASSAATAVTIDFETGFVDNQDIATASPFMASTAFAAQGVTFSSSQTDLVIEEAGDADDNPDGFVYDQGSTNDLDVDPDNDLGTYFLRTRGEITERGLGAADPVMTIAYSGPAATLISGEIWDVDGNQGQGSEQWVVQAKDSSGAILGSLTSPNGTTNSAGSLDGMAWLFSFSSANVSDPGAIASLDFFFTGTKTQGIGLAFDNFKVEAIPLPAPALLLLTGLAGLAWIGRRRA